MNSYTNNADLLNALSQPFHPAHITWKPGALTKEKNRALALAYADLRAYMQRLDEVCGLGWSVTYRPWGDRIICELTIDGVTRSSTGEPDSQSEKSEIGGTAAEAQAFKRACAMFGMGRYLYTLPSVWAEYDAEKKQFSDQGKARLNEIVVQHYRRHMAAALEDGSITNGNGHHPPAVKPESVNAKSAELEALAKLYYEETWESELRRLVKYISEGRTDAYTQLQDAEADKLIDGLTKKLQSRTPALA
ncbi:MAG: hypothetical protein KF893_01295 [Caldilineaceae bacterium]|nr:hypothetical protein [Caldilineaceae bacterium]